MNRLKPCLLTGILLGIVTLAGAQQTVSIHGFSRSYMGLLTDKPHEYSIIQNTLDLELEHSRGAVAFKVNPYVYQYPNRTPVFDIREAYLDLYTDHLDLRVGKQQILWGRAEGVFITDIVSPKNLEEFLLREFDEIRSGVTAVKADYYPGNHGLELVWIPAFTGTQLPSPGSIWYPRMEFPLPVTIDNSNLAVEGQLDNSEWFGKWFWMSPAIDLEFMAGYAWDDDPAPHVYPLIDATTRQPAGLTIRPEHHRLGIAGGSFSTTLAPLVLRGELARYAGKYFQTADFMTGDGTLEKDYLHALLGVDYTWRDLRLSSQIIAQNIQDYEDVLIREEHEYTATLMAARTFRRETLMVQIFGYVGLTHGDVLFRPSLTYDLTDGFEVIAGLNIFSGDEGNFGRYDANDMAYLKIKYSF